MAILKFLLKTTVIILLTLIVIAGAFYFNTNIYDYTKTAPFTGDSIYNPYKDFNGKSYKANFHAHTVAWSSFTNGKNSDTELFNAYKVRKYGFIGISNYFKITDYAKQQNSIYIPIYEHGYSVFKSHRLVIGSNKISYFDYPLFQSTSHKQKIIENLKNDKAIVVLAHPEFFNGLCYNEMKNLCNYDLIEVINHYCVSDKHWDSALSSGRLSFLLANDDTHDIYREATFKNWNNIFCSTLDSASILKAVVAGHNYGIQSKNRLCDNYLKSVTIDQDKVKIRFTNKANNIKLIGQWGHVISYAKNIDSIEYIISKHDTYIRAVAENDNSKIFLNPIIRYDGQNLPLVSNIKPKLNLLKTCLFIISILIIEYLSVRLIFKIQQDYKIYPY